MGANAQTAVPVFTAGQILTAAQVTQINTGIPVFATTTTRDAAFGGTGEKTLAQGQYAYIEATSTLQVYSGSAWITATSGGLNSCVPTSVTVGSGSATTSTNGQVSFTGVSSVSLNGVFSSTYDNYCFILTPSALSADMNINMRYRVGGTDASGANYTQVDALNSTSSAWGVSTATGSTVISVGQALESTDPYLYAVQGNIYSPFKAAPTTYFSNAPTYINVAIYRVYLTSGWHSLSTSYDGISFITSTGTMTGTVSVYGYNK